MHTYSTILRHVNMYHIIHTNTSTITVPWEVAYEHDSQCDRSLAYDLKFVSNCITYNLFNIFSEKFIYCAIPDDNDNNNARFTAIFQDKPNKPWPECFHSDVIGAMMGPGAFQCLALTFSDVSGGNSWRHYFFEWRVWNHCCFRR